MEKGEIPIISKKEYTDDVENFHDIKWCNVWNLHEITFFMELKAEAENKGILFEQETIRNLFNDPGDISLTIPWLSSRAFLLRNS